MRRPAVFAHAALLPVLLAALLVGACSRNKPPVARPTQPPPPADTVTAGSRPPAPPMPVSEPTVVPPEPVRDDNISSASLDDLNRNSPLRPVFFEYDSTQGNAAEAARFLEEARRAAGRPEFARDAEAAAFLREAEQTTAGSGREVAPPPRPVGR